MCTLKMTVKINLEKKIIHVHNVYNFSSESYSAQDSLSTLSRAREMLKVSEEHILLDDFNLHHSY